MRTKRMAGRLLSVLLCLVMVLGLLPTAAFAAESGETTGSGTETDPYCVSTYDELKRLLEDKSSSEDVYIEVEKSFEKTLRYNTDYGYSSVAIDVYGKKHLEIPKNTELIFHNDRNVKYTNRLNALMYVNANAELSITGEGMIKVNFVHLGINNIICSYGKLTIDGNVLFNGQQTLTYNTGGWCSPIEVGGGQTIINGGRFYAYNGMGPGTREGFTSAVWVEEGSLEINGGEFRAFGDLSSRDDYTGARRVWPLCLNAGKNVTLKGGTFVEGMSVSGGSGIANVLADGYQLLSWDKDGGNIRLLSKDELTGIEEIENEVIVIPKVSVSDVKLTPYGDTAISSLGKATITPGESSKTFTITATAADWLKNRVTDETRKTSERAAYTLTALVHKNGEPLYNTYDVTKYTVAYEENGADSDGNPYIQIKLKDAPKAGDVYSIAAFVKPVARDTENQLCDSAFGTWTLTTEAAPVAHNITIQNGYGTASPSTAKAGDTVTVTATDRTGDKLMFTQWYTGTSGVTFANATQRITTFIMPDCDVTVNPGFQGVGFTKQPASTYWTQAGYEKELTAAFSYPITKWELREGSNTIISGGSVSANEEFTVTVPQQDTDASKTYTIVVTANGQQFSSNAFTVNWSVYGKAPAVVFNPVDGTQFVEELEVRLSNATNSDAFEIFYTLDDTDPKDSSTAVDSNNETTYVKLSDTTTITARTCNNYATDEDAKWGPLVKATFTCINTLPTPKIIPGGLTYTDPVTVYLSAPALHDVSMEYQIVQQGKIFDEENSWEKYSPESGITVNEWGTVTLYARTFKNVERKQGDSWYTDHMTSETATATYSLFYTAEIENVTVSGKVDQTIAETDVTLKLDGEKFKGVAAGNDVSTWFNLPAGLTATFKEINSNNNVLIVTISGEPTEASAAAITVTIPKENLKYNTDKDLTVLSNPKAYYSIGKDDTHEHDFTGQPWISLDDEIHYQMCKSNDGGVNPQQHSFDDWTPDTTNTDKHYKECSVCGHKVSASHDESSRITDTPAGIGTEGSWYTKCLDCGKQMDSGTLDALTKIDVANLTVAKPVKGEAPANATTTDTAYTVAYTEWMDQNGDPLNAGDKFQPGTVYTAKITLEGKDNNAFSANSNYNKIAGKTAAVSPELTGSEYAYSVVLTYTFDKTEGTYVPDAPTITTTTLPGGKVGEAYSQTLTATGDHPITWSVDSGDLPDGLTLVGDTIKGTPSKAGSFTFTVKASNTAGDATQAFTVTIADADAAKYHNVTLSGAGAGATGAGSHAANTPVNIYAGTKYGYTFAGWTSDDVTVLSASDKNASFVMPDKDVTVKANWIYNGGGSGGGYTYYTIKATAGVNGSISPSGNVSVREGRDQTFTITPDKGYAVAKVLVDSKNVGAVKSYTFENVKKNHTIEVVFMKSSGNPQTGVFVDVPEGSYYEEAVNWAVEQGITTGTDATHFSPDGICTRAQAVTFLWRAAGSPAPKSTTMPFTDVPAGSYYYDAVLWAVENGITKGTSNITFSPNMNCSRAQIVTFLWRSEKSPAAGTVNPFTDVKSDAYYADAVLWAVKEGITKGTSNTTFSPDADCTRAEIVTFLWRCKK